MDSTNVNGGNAEVSQEDSNLNESIGSSSNSVVLPGDTPVTPIETQHSTGKVSPTEAGNADTQEVNGDFKSSFMKRPTTPSSRKKHLKFKANSASTFESDTEMMETRVNKRKFVDLDDVSSDDSLGFSGFDLQLHSEMRGTSILKKLIGNVYILSFSFIIHSDIIVQFVVLQLLEYFQSNLL